jgi:DNA polymerase III sliding clamp (beta) subunit (PCNA family)
VSLNPETFGIEDSAEVVLSFSLAAADLLDALTKTSAVLAGREFVPVLANFVLTATPGNLRVVTSNLDLAMVSRVLPARDELTVPMPGKAYFPVRRFLDVVKQAAGTRARLYVLVSRIGEALSAQVRSTSPETGTETSWTLALHSGVGYPALPSLGDLSLVQTDAKSVVTALRAVTYAADATTSHSYHVIRFDRGSSGRTSITAADRSRIARATVESFPITTVLPVHAANDLLVLAEKAETLAIGQTKTHVVVRTETDLLVIARPNTELPDLSSQINEVLTRNTAHVKVAHRELFDAVKSVRVTADTDTPFIVIEMATNTCNVSSYDKFGNSAKVILTATGLVPKMLTLVFNFKLLLQALVAWPSDDIEIAVAPGMTKTTNRSVLFSDQGATTLSLLAQISI